MGLQSKGFQKSHTGLRDYTTTLLDGAVSLLIDGFDEFGCTRSFLHLEGPLDGTCKLLVPTWALCVLAGEHFAVECGLSFPDEGPNAGPVHW